jgi:hypothetical protein
MNWSQPSLTDYRPGWTQILEQRSRKKNERCTPHKWEQ